MTNEKMGFCLNKNSDQKSQERAQKLCLNKKKLFDAGIGKRNAFVYPETEKDRK